MPDDQPAFRELLRPRPLSTAEQRLLSWLAHQLEVFDSDAGEGVTVDLDGLTGLHLDD